MTNYLVNNLLPTSAGDVISPRPNEDDRVVLPSPQDFGTRSTARDSTTRASSPGKVLPIHPIPNGATYELFTQIKRIIADQTHVSADVSALLTFWVISTWFQEALTLAPCLAITGPAHEANVVLRTLNVLCCRPVLMTGFNSAALKDFRWDCSTLLMSEPNLSKRAAALLGCFTNRGFMMPAGGYYVSCFGSKAIFTGDVPPLMTILHSVHINATAAPSVESPDARQLSTETMKPFRNQLLHYRERNLGKVRQLEFNALGLPLEAHAVANALGSCIVDAPELQAELVALLRPHAQQQTADRSDSLEALVVDAALTLCHQGKNQIYVREIAIEVNRLQEVRGETLRFSPEKVGHQLKKVGLFTRRLSQKGNGLLMDRATTARLHEVAADYRQDDLIEEDRNLHCSLCQQNRGVKDVM
jgi:hypothetical protein